MLGERCRERRRGVERERHNSREERERGVDRERHSIGRARERENRV